MRVDKLGGVCQGCVAVVGEINTLLLRPQHMSALLQPFHDGHDLPIEEVRLRRQWHRSG